MEPSRRLLVQRMAQPMAYAAMLIVISLGVGMLGYHACAGLPWIDAFVNTCMLLGGMGPVSPIDTTDGKIFAGLFALYAGLVFIVTAGLLFAPLVHRLMHRLHWDQK